MNRTEEVEKIIDYTFTDKTLLIKALTHPSYSYENNTESYQNFEFLGDSILDFIVAEHLIKLNPSYDEGQLTKSRAETVAMEPLADVIDNAGLDEFILLGNGSSASKKTRSDIFESLVAAIYNDSNLENSKQFILKFLGEQLQGRKTENDYKSRLLELSAKKNFSVEFVYIDTTGPKHRPQFKFEVRIDGKAIGTGEDYSKKSAQQEAARQALKILEKND